MERLNPRIIIQGSYIKAYDCFPKKMEDNNPKEKAKRGDIKGFSRAARRRMLAQVAKMGKAVPIFLTVTYPNVWPRDPELWKTHLTKFLKRLLRLDPELAGLWRLEPQDRGAPHYHFLIYREGKRPFVCKDWIAKNWSEVLGEYASSDGLLAGTRIESIDSFRGAAFYCSKYCAKLPKGETHSEEWASAKKLWGVFNKSKLPEAKQHEMVLHSPMEQKAILFTMRDRFKKAFLSKLAKDNEKKGYNASDAMGMAIHEWKELKEESSYFGNTTTSYGSGEDFLDDYSKKITELELVLSDRANRNPNLKKLDNILERVASVL